MNKLAKQLSLETEMNTLGGDRGRFITHNQRKKKMTANEQVSYDIYQPFGPSVMKASVPQVAIDLVNKISDDILKDKKKRQELDWHDNLAGNVKYEIALPLHEISSMEQLLSRLASEYIMKTVKDQVDLEKTDMSYRAWVVSQYAGDFNPIHIFPSRGIYDVSLKVTNNNTGWVMLYYIII